MLTNGVCVCEYGDSQVNYLIELCDARRIEVAEVAKNEVTKEDD